MIDQLKDNQLRIFTRDWQVAADLLSDLSMMGSVESVKGTMCTILTFPSPADADAFLDLFLDKFEP